MTASVVTPAPRRSPYLVGAAYDGVWFLGSMLVPYAMALVYWVLGPGEKKAVVVALYVAFQLLFNLPHNAQTWSLTVLEGHERAAHPARYWGSVAVSLGLLVSTMALSPRGAWPLLNSAIIYWGYWHLIKQHFGFVRLYEMRAGVKDSYDKALSRALLYVGGLAPLVQRIADGNVMLDPGRGVPMEIAHVAVPQVVATVWWMGSAVLLALYCVRLVTSETRAVLAAVTLVGALANFAISLQLVDDLIVSVVIMTVWHNLQYLGLVFFMSGNRARLQGGGRQLVKLAGQRRVMAYVAVLLAYAVVILGARVALPEPWGALPITLVVALHYFHDSFIWKISSNPTLRQELGMKA